MSQPSCTGHNGAVFTMEFTLDPAFRKAEGVRAVVLLVISVLFAFGAVTGFGLAILPAAFFFVSAVGCGIKWWGRLNFRTTVSHEGIEVQGYRVRRISWAEVKGFEFGAAGTQDGQLRGMLEAGVMF